VNLFVVGWSPRGAADAGRAAGALRELLTSAGFLDPRRIETWTAPSGAAAAAWAQHDPAQTGGVRHAHFERDRLALFAGRPIRWVGEEADGRGPLDPRHYLAPADGWVDAMDGRWAAARIDDAAGELEVAADAMGAYPLFRARDAGGTSWFSGNPEALALLADDPSWDAEVLAGLLGGGFSLTGDPWWRAVRRVPRGAVVRLRRGEPETVSERFTAAEIARLPGAGFEPARAARALVAGLAALADWRGRPSQVPITAGRDSRLVLAAALHGEFDWEAVTAGVPGMEDVDRGRAVCDAAGVQHHLAAFDPHGNLLERPRRMAQVVALSGAGTACVADASGFPLGPRDGTPVLWHSGQGGEIARAYYGTGAGTSADRLADHLYRHFTTSRPGRPPLLADHGAHLIRARLAAFVEQQLGLGARPADVPDLFYLHARLAAWAGPSHGCVEWVRDTTSPLWSRRLLADQLGPAPRERSLELFHQRVLEELAPQLVDVPFEGGRGWPARQSAVQRRAAHAGELARKVLAEARRRRPRRRAPAQANGDPSAPEDGFEVTTTAVREAALAQRGHPAWEVLDRGRVDALLTRDPVALDPMSRAYVRRLATVFLREGGD
jgi:hypothetical protein